MALRIAMDMIESLSYKLITFGLNLEGKSEVYCDNKSVVKNSSVTASVLNKRHNDIYYHRVREAQAAETLSVGCIPGDYNLVDLLTKTAMTGNMRHRMVELVFCNKSAVIRDMDES